MLAQPVSGLSLVAHKQRLECVQPSIRSFDNKSALIQLIVKQIVMICSVPFVDGDVGTYLQALAKFAHPLAVEARRGRPRGRR